MRGHTHTHLEAGDHGPLLPLLIVPDYDVDGATKGPKDQDNPVKGKFYFLISMLIITHQINFSIAFEAEKI